MRGKNRKPIASYLKLLQFTTMNVIDGQASLVITYSSLIFYSLTIDNILNIIVLLILAGVSIITLTGENGLLTKSNEAVEENIKGEERDQLSLAYQAVKLDKLANSDNNNITADELEDALEENGITPKQV